jgi:hypothetical protein
MGRSLQLKGRTSEARSGSLISLPGGNRSVENGHAEGRIRRETRGEIAGSWTVRVLALIRGGRNAEDWTAAAAEPSFFVMVGVFEMVIFV